MPSREHLCGGPSRNHMTTSTLMLIAIGVFVIGGLSGLLLAALLHTAKDSHRRQNALDTKGLHPLDLPTH